MTEVKAVVGQRMDGMGSRREEEGGKVRRGNWSPAGEFLPRIEEEHESLSLKFRIFFNFA